MIVSNLLRRCVAEVMITHTLNVFSIILFFVLSTLTLSVFYVLIVDKIEDHLVGMYGGEPSISTPTHLGFWGNNILIILIFGLQNI